MKKYKLKNWVLPAVYLFSVGTVGLSIMYISNNIFISNQNTEDYTYVSNEITEDNIKEVLMETNETVDHPYLMENVRVAKNFYNQTDSEEDKVNSLLYYKNTYMQNSGILYSSDEKFDVVSVLDGTVTSITKDEILGTVVEVMHTTELVTIYQCLDSTPLNVGDQVKKNDVIGTSGKVNIDKGYENALLFEVNHKGQVLNPSELYNMKISDLK